MQMNLIKNLNNNLTSQRWGGYSLVEIIAAMAGISLFVLLLVFKPKSKENFYLEAK